MTTKERNKASKYSNHIVRFFLKPPHGRQQQVRQVKMQMQVGTSKSCGPEKIAANKPSRAEH